MPSKGYLFGQKSCHCGCEVCPHCSASCLSVVLAGFSGTAEGCDCDLVNGTFLLTRGRGRAVDVAVTTSTGSGATFRVTLGWDDERGTHYIASVEPVDGGESYSGSDTAAIVYDAGEVVCNKTPELELTVEGGVITGVEVIEPGEFVFSSDGGAGDPCTYSFCEPIECGESVKIRDISLTITETTRVLSVKIDGVEVARGEVDAEENPCDDMTFEAGDFTGDCSPGTALVENAECDGKPPAAAAVCNYTIVMHGRTGEGNTYVDEDTPYEEWGIIPSGTFAGYYFWVQETPAASGTFDGDSVTFSMSAGYMVSPPVILNDNCCCSFFAVTVVKGAGITRNPGPGTGSPVVGDCQGDNPEAVLSKTKYFRAGDNGCIEAVDFSDFSDQVDWCSTPPVPEWCDGRNRDLDDPSDYDACAAFYQTYFPDFITPDISIEVDEENPLP